MEPLGVTVVSLKGNTGELVGAGLKKGEHTLVKAYVRSNNYKNADGDVKYRQQLIFKGTEPVVKTEEQVAAEDVIDAEEVMNL